MRDKNGIIVKHGDIIFHDYKGVLTIDAIDNTALVCRTGDSKDNYIRIETGSNFEIQPRLTVPTDCRGIVIRVGYTLVLDNGTVFKVDKIDGMKVQRVYYDGELITVNDCSKSEIIKLNGTEEEITLGECEVGDFVEIKSLGYSCSTPFGIGSICKVVRTDYAICVGVSAGDDIVQDVLNKSITVAKL